MLFDLHKKVVTEGAGEGEAGQDAEVIHVGQFLKVRSTSKVFLPWRHRSAIPDAKPPFS